LGNVFNKFVPQFPGGLGNLGEDRFGTALKMDCFAPPIVRRILALDPPIILQAMEQSRE
jgi:hypothetical protein